MAPSPAGTTVRNNLIGWLADGVTPSPNQGADGIIVWANALNVRAEDNTIGQHTGDGISVSGGRNHQIRGNRIGADANGTAAATLPQTGVAIRASAGSTVRALGVGNVVHAFTDGVVVGTASSTKVGWNTVEASRGVQVSGFSEGTVISGNMVKGDGSASVYVGADSAGTWVTGNTLLGHDYGVRNLGEGTEISKNEIGRAADGTLDAPTIGIRSQSSSTITNNVVAGSENNAIVISGSAIALMTANEIDDTGGKPIVAPSGPAAPVLSAAILTGSGRSRQTALIVTGLPKAGTGTVEVFANRTCADGEANDVLDLTIAKPDGRSYVVVPVGGGAITSPPRTPTLPAAHRSCPTVNRGPRIPTATATARPTRSRSSPAPPATPPPQSC